MLKEHMSGRLVDAFLPHFLKYTKTLSLALSPLTKQMCTGERVGGHEGSEDIQLEVPLGATHGDGSIIAHYLKKRKRDKPKRQHREREREREREQSMQL